MNIDDETTIKKVLKGTIKIESGIRLPFLNCEDGNPVGPIANDFWLKSIRLTPEPPPELMLSDIMIGRASIFAGSGQHIQARLLNRIDSGSLVWQPVGRQQIVTLVLTGCEYTGFCEIELVVPPVPPKSFISLLPIGPHVNYNGNVRILVAEPDTMKAFENPDPEEFVSIDTSHGPQFSHQIFTKERVDCKTRPGRDGMVVLHPPLTVLIGQNITIQKKRGLESEELGTKGEIVAILEVPGT